MASRLEYEFWCYDHDFDPVEMKKSDDKRLERKNPAENPEGPEEK